jgi:hypothetical protein
VGQKCELNLRLQLETQREPESQSTTTIQDGGLDFQPNQPTHGMTNNPNGDTWVFRNVSVATFSTV